MRKKVVLAQMSTIPPTDCDKAGTIKENAKLVKQLSAIQDKLFAQNKYSVLIILQGMDTAGKDSAVKHVFSGVNPAGCNVMSFKVPTPEEAAHHFLWRVSTRCPGKGMIQIFNRSHYEEILMPLVHSTQSKAVLEARCKEINVFESGLILNNTILIKFYLHISHKEQMQRLNERRNDKSKQWKFSEEDIVDIKKHKAYKAAYEFIFKHCSQNPWLIVPADKKWYKNNQILKIIVNKLSDYTIEYPQPNMK
ncbi:MAG: polyphosphate kinase [Bacteroidia bacterium]|nr:polyphosphate kinase [Bacteroidia bacterium]